MNCDNTRWRLTKGSKALQRKACDAFQPHAAAGVLFGAGFGYAGYLIQQQPERGFRFGTTVSLLLVGVMGYRFYKTGKFMPAGGLASLGAASAAYHLMKYKEWTE